MMAFILATDFYFIAYMSKMVFFFWGGGGGGKLFSRQWRFWNMIEDADQTFHLTQSQYTDTGPTSLSADPVRIDAWQAGHWITPFLNYWYDST